MRFRVVIIQTIAGNATQVHALVFPIPMVNGKHDEPLVDSPSIWQCSDERAVDHVPDFGVVLLFYIQDVE